METTLSSYKDITTVPNLSTTDFIIDDDFYFFLLGLCVFTNHTITEITGPTGGCRRLDSQLCEPIMKIQPGTTLKMKPLGQRENPLEE